MEQFNLDTWLKDKSRKVTTRLGNREVRIICWDRKNNNNHPIITLMIDPAGNEYITFHTKNGFVDEEEKYIDKRDLFFADEEELTEFDYAVLSIISDHNSHTDSIEDFAKRSSKKLLDLAKKEILKDLPKLKKTKDVIDPTIPVMYTYAASMKSYVEYNGYKLCINDVFEKLPKEEL